MSAGERTEDKAKLAKRDADPVDVRPAAPHTRTPGRQQLNAQRP